MDAQRETEAGDAVDHTLVQVDHQLPLLRGFGFRQPLDERLLVGDGGVAWILDQPVDQADARLDLRYEAERQQYLGAMVGALRELGEKAHDGIGVQQLRHAVRRTLVALEVEPAMFTVAGGDQDDPAVGHQLVIDRQRVGGRNAGTLTVVHGSRYADESNAIESGVAQIGQPVTQGRLIQEGGDLGAQPLHPWQLRLDDRPEVQHVQPGLQLEGTIVILLDHPGNHDVPDPAVDTGFFGETQHLMRVL